MFSSQLSFCSPLVFQVRLSPFATEPSYHCHHKGFLLLCLEDHGSTACNGEQFVVDLCPNYGPNSATQILLLEYSSSARITIIFQAVNLYAQLIFLFFQLLLFSHSSFIKTIHLLPSCHQLLQSQVAKMELWIKYHFTKKLVREHQQENESNEKEQ